MKKIQLNPEALRVESFTTAREEAAMGTVHAHAQANGSHAPQSCDIVHCEMTWFPSCVWINCENSTECEPPTDVCMQPTDDCVADTGNCVPETSDCVPLTANC